MTEIGISTVLNEINQPVQGDRVHTFSIAWIRTSGNKKGTEKRIQNTQKYSKNPQKKSSNVRAGGVGFNLRENSTLLLTDVEATQTVSVKIWSIIEYNGYRVRH